MNELLTEQEAADLLKCSIRWLKDRRYAQEVPFIVLPPKLVRYDRAQLLEWARSHANDVSNNVSDELSDDD